MVGAINGSSSRRKSMSDKGISVVATIKAKLGQEEKVKQLLLGLVSPTRSEAGCINYDLHQAVDDKALFMFYENWTSKEDLDRHLAKPYLQAFLGQAEQILAEPVQIAILNMISPR
jgi:quinol monooxygenase YgiN